MTDSNDTNDLLDLLNPKLVLKNIKNDPNKVFSYDDRKKHLNVKLREEKAENSEIEIKNVPEDLIIIRSDLYKPSLLLDDESNLNKFIPAFNGKNNENCCADFIMISESKKVILYIEVKSEKARNNHVANQLKGAQCFLRTCKLYIESFWYRHDFLSDYKIRFIKFLHTDKKNAAGNQNIRVRKTSNVMRSRQSESPEKAYLPMSSSPFFRELISD